MENQNNIEHLRYERAKKRVKSVAGFYRHLSVYILVNLFLLSLTYFTLEPGAVFFKFENFTTAFFWGVGLMFHALGTFGPVLFFGPDWEERKISEIMDKNKTRKWE